MATVVPKEVRRLMETMVVIINEGDEPFVDKFDGDYIVLQPGHGAYVSYEKARLWLGDPTLRTTNPAEWNREMLMLRSRHGEKTFAQLMAGKVYVQEWGKGDELYHLPKTKAETTIANIPLDQLLSRGQTFKLPDEKSLEAIDEVLKTGTAPDPVEQAARRDRPNGVDDPVDQVSSMFPGPKQGSKGK